MLEQEQQQKQDAVSHPGRADAPAARTWPSTPRQAAVSSYTIEGKSWVLLTESPPHIDPAEYAADCLGSLGTGWGEGSILVQEQLNPYLGALELNSVISAEETPREAEAVTTVDSRGRECIVLYA